MLDAGARAALAATRFTDVRWRPEVGSTNDEVAALARAGAPEGTVVVADCQTAGRGRRGRSWEAPAGSSLLASVLLRPAVPHLALMAAGLAALDACRGVAGVAAALKWPNDLVVADGKLAGILAEAVGDAVVVGLGLNVAWDGPLPAGAASLSGSAGRAVDRAELLVAWLQGLDARCRQPGGAVLADYRAACSTIGRRVRVDTAGGAVEGRADAVDDMGRLVVDGRPIGAGDVVHLLPGS